MKFQLVFRTISFKNNWATHGKLIQLKESEIGKIILLH